MVRGARRFCIALAALAAAAAATEAGAGDRLSFGQVSPTATIWPGLIAAKKGFFAASNIEMQTVSIGVSPGMQAVATGSLDVMQNTCNAPIAFFESGGANVRIAMVSMAIHPAVLIGRKGVARFADLKGRVIGTSSLKSGSTILLRRLLKAHGLGEADYDLVAGQGSAQMFGGLQAGAIDAVWLVPPQSFVAASAGYPVLGSFREVAPSFPFVCFATSTQFLQRKPDIGRRFLSAWRAAVGWLQNVSHRGEAEALLAAELKVPQDAVARTYDDLIVQNPQAFPRDGRLDAEALRAMIRVMVEGEELKAMPQGDIRKYLDESLLAGN